MESNRFLLFFIFGISPLPNIYSVGYPSLFVIKKPNTSYAVADEIQFVEDQKNVLTFSTSPEYLLFNACPEEKAPHRRPDALEVQRLVIDFEASPSQQFLESNFLKYNCWNPIKPIVLKSRERFGNKFVIDYDIGFLIHDNKANLGELWKKYPTFPKVPGYDFITFLTITMDRQSGTTMWVRHRIISRGLLVPDSRYLGPLPDFEKNADVYGFNVNLLYEMENQQKMFSLIFGENYSRYYNHQEDQYLIKVQLAPYEDFLLKTWKLTSFMDLNTTAIWKKLHPQWKTVEMFVRGVARYLEPLIVETGTAKVLTLPVAKKKLQSVYLRDGQKSPVPQLIWKQVAFKPFDDDANTQAVLIVMHNDPYTQNQKPICDDVSESLGWKISNKDHKTGLTYVCPVDEEITTKLHDGYKANYRSLNLNNAKKLEPAGNDIFPSLFVLKHTDKFYSVAYEFESVKGQDSIIKFSTSTESQLYNICPEENAPFYRTYTLKVQESVTDFEARPLQQFIEGDFVEYNCTNPIKPVVLKSKKKYDDKFAVGYDIGFLFRDKNFTFHKLSEYYENFTEIQEYGFLHFLGIVMDRKSATVISLSYRIFNKGIPAQEPTNSGPSQSNKNNIDIYGFDVNSLYTEENQQKMFSSIFGKSFSRFYDYPDRCLIKFQLAPHEDFLLNTWKLPLLMDLNTGAMWKQLYPQWKIIETFVREVARKLPLLIIETGLSKILTLPVGKKKPQSVYLREGQKSHVPKYIWKVVKFDKFNDDTNTRAVLIVMHNDPYTPDQKLICEDVGESLGWMVSNKDYKTGLTYVCPVNLDITTKLDKLFVANIATFNVDEVVSEINDIFPSLFIIKRDNIYTVADKFEYVEGQDNAVKFSTSPQYQLYNACPEEESTFYPSYTLKIQEVVTDFQASPLQQFIEGDFVKYNCLKQIRPTVLKSKETFNDKFVFEYDIGFLVHDINGNFDKLSELYVLFSEVPSPKEYGFLRFLTIRRDERSGTVLETSHQIISRGLLEPDSAYSAPSRLNEKDFSVYTFDLNSLYTQENQAKIFSSFFPEQNNPYYNHQEDQYLIKVQLAPHEDFPLNTWKLPSLIDLNTTAMWKQLHLQWRKIEKFVREVARKLETLTIATGAVKILTLAEVNGQQKPVYLREEQKYAVAQYIWKLVKFEQLENDYYTQAILIVMHNDPYTTDQKPICDDVSENWGWMVSNKDYKTGLTYGCQVVGNITSNLHDEYRVNYASLNLNDVRKLEYDKNDTFPSLFVIKKPNKFYAVADKFEYVKGQDNVLKFSTSPGHQLYNACPEKDALFHPTYDLKVQELVTDFQARPLQQFIKGDFVKYNCRYPIRPIVLKSKLEFKDEFAVEYGIGFLMHESNGNFNKLSEKYENFTEIQEYDFLHFLAITLDTQSGTILSVLHQIISRGLLEPESDYSDTIPLNEKNVDIYGFDVNFLYTEENQRKMFSMIFGQSYTNYYSPPNQSLRKVQLAPYEDFLLNTWKLPSLMDLNTAAMWDQLHPQWRRIEVFVRRVAREMDALTIETGAARILSLPDAEGKQQSVYLREGKKSPVPKYFWKLIKFDQLDDNQYSQAILIVMHNDPYNQNQKPICDDVSQNWGWMVSNKDYKKGLTYGCKVVGNITRKLHDEYNENYGNFDLKAVHTLGYYNNGLIKWLKENIYSKVMSRL